MSPARPGCLDIARLAALLAMALLVGTPAGSLAQLGSRNAMKIDTALAEALGAAPDPGQRFGVIIRFTAGAEDAAARRGVLQRLGITPTAVYENLPGAAAMVTRAQIDSLAAAAEVSAIEADSTATTLLPRR